MRPTPESDNRGFENRNLAVGVSEEAGARAEGVADASAVRTSAPADLELVRRAREGDMDAFDELVRLHTPQLYRLLVRILGNATAAEDVAQECFVRAWRALPNFRGEARFSTWLYRIAINEANRFLARESKRELLPYDDILLEVPDLRAQTAELVEASDLRAQLERLLAELPAHHRAAVVLRDVEGFSNEEAADVLELDLRNFKSRLHRGRMALRRLLEEHIDTN